MTGEETCDQPQAVRGPGSTWRLLLKRKDLKVFKDFVVVEVKQVAGLLKGKTTDD